MDNSNSTVNSTPTDTSADHSISPVITASLTSPLPASGQSDHATASPSSAGLVPSFQLRGLGIRLSDMPYIPEWNLSAAPVVATYHCYTQQVSGDGTKCLSRSFYPFDRASNTNATRVIALNHPARDVELFLVSLPVLTASVGTCKRLRSEHYLVAPKTEADGSRPKSPPWNSIAAAVSEHDVSVTETPETITALINEDNQIVASYMTSKSFKTSSSSCEQQQRTFEPDPLASLYSRTSEDGAFRIHFDIHWNTSGNFRSEILNSMRNIASQLGNGVQTFIGDFAGITDAASPIPLYHRGTPPARPRGRSGTGAESSPSEYPEEV